VIVNGKGENLLEDRFYPIDDVRYTLHMSITCCIPVHTDHSTTGPPVAAVLFGYDPVGNMTSRTMDGVSYTLTYDAENRLGLS